MMALCPQQAAPWSFCPNSPTSNGTFLASSDETAFPYSAKGHGLFTYYLLKKLQETKGDVSLGELESYISENVKQQSVVINRKVQTPTATPSTSLAAGWKELKLK